MSRLEDMGKVFKTFFSCLTSPSDCALLLGQISYHGLRCLSSLISDHMLVTSLCSSHTKLLSDQQCFLFSLFLLPAPFFR